MTTLILALTHVSMWIAIAMIGGLAWVNIWDGLTGLRIELRKWRRS